ncbi:hypothetical protein CTAYLR_008768 [Chrysophaeum taylorii]|uniref:Ion transport domain-containing protein n=1 Tax=Chrysophaeum taylorii TaxID=2483200 RepID=A0AAD7UCT9_9STRA|nr:hypothetical protein CTAYLR_008768 [Chrysophaeum taylorii]
MTEEEEEALEEAKECDPTEEREVAVAGEAPLGPPVLAEERPEAQSRIFRVVGARVLEGDKLLRYNAAWFSWQEEDEEGVGALARLCANPGVTGAHVSAVAEGLMRARAAERADSEGRCALHYACANPNATPQLVETVAKLDPTILLKRGGAGQTPLHDACSVGAKHPVLLSLCKLEVAALGVKDDFGNTPLHNLCAAQNELTELKLSAVLQVVDEQAPKLLLEANDDGSTPLHALCANPTATPDLFTLVGTPEAAQIKANVLRRSDSDNNNPRSLSRKSTDEKVGGGSSSGGGKRSSTMGFPSKFPSKFLTNRLKMDQLFNIGTHTHRNLHDDAGVLPLHVLCGTRKVTPDLLKGVARLFPDAAKTRTDKYARLPIHLLALNDTSVNPGNLAVLTALHPTGVDEVDAHERTPLDLMARWVIERYAPQLLAIYPKKALEPLPQCQFPLLHYASCIDVETTEQVIATYHSQLKETPPLEVFISLPERSREHVASTSVIVNRVDKIFTAPAVVAFLMWEMVTGILMVFAFFRLVFLANNYNSKVRKHEGLQVFVVLSSIHIAHIIFTKIIYFKKLATKKEILSFWNFTDFLVIGSWVVLVTVVEVGRGRSFRAVAALTQLILPIRILKMIKGLNQNIGAFVLCLMNVLYAIVPFLFIFMLILVSFAQSFTTLLSHKNNYDMGELEADGTVVAAQNEYASFARSVYSVYRLGLVGDLDADYFDDTVVSVFVLVLFILVISIVMLNMLIAVVSDAYETTLTNSESIYLRSRLESAAEMTTMFPHWMFDEDDTNFLSIMSVVLFPATLAWALTVFIARTLDGPQRAKEMYPKRLLAYARHPEEEDQQPEKVSREKILEKAIVKVLAKLQEDLEDRLSRQDDTFNERLDALEAAVVALKLDKRFIEAVSDQNKHLDSVIGRLHKTPIQSLPPDVLRRLEDIEVAMSGILHPDLAVDAYDAFITPCIAPSHPDDDHRQPAAANSPFDAYASLASCLAVPKADDDEDDDDAL